MTRTQREKIREKSEIAKVAKKSDKEEITRNLEAAVKRMKKKKNGR